MRTNTTRHRNKQIVHKTHQNGNTEASVGLEAVLLNWGSQKCLCISRKRGCRKNWEVLDIGNWYTSAWFEPKDRKGVAHLSKSKQRIHGSAKARVTTVPVRKLKRWGWCTSLWKGNSRGPKSRKIFQQEVDTTIISYSGGVFSPASSVKWQIAALRWAENGWEMVGEMEVPAVQPFWANQDTLASELQALQKRLVRVYWQVRGLNI